MEIKRFPAPVLMTLEEFADKNGLVMEVRARDEPERFHLRFSARFSHAGVQDGTLLKSISGKGATEDLAIGNYAREISGRLIVIDSMGADRREIEVPKLARWGGEQ